MDITPISPENRIHSIRGQRVMLDADLADMYGVETRALNQAVRRNIGRFPHDFRLELTREEVRRISQIVTSSGASPNLKFSKSVTANFLSRDHGTLPIVETP